MGLKTLHPWPCFQSWVPSLKDDLKVLHFQVYMTTTLAVTNSPNETAYSMRLPVSFKQSHPRSPLFFTLYTPVVHVSIRVPLSVFILPKLWVIKRGHYQVRAIWQVTWMTHPPGGGGINKGGRGDGLNSGHLVINPYINGQSVLWLFNNQKTSASPLTIYVGDVRFMTFVNVIY